MDKLRTRTFRDPIHGDIFVGAVQSSIVDTTLFQRLRFIRQNGLLHFVFPGAVHTRFAHSLGTMHLAQRVFAVLFPDYSPRRSTSQKARRSPLAYIAAVFETAALLHDVGHGAFSHSIERVKIKNEALFPPLQQLVDTWSQKEGKGLAEWWHSRIDSGQYTPPSQTEHEDIGLLMIGVLFGGHYETVSATCESWLGVKSSVFADDVRAMLVTDQRLKPSDHFIGCADEITKSISSAATINRETRAEDLLVWLHTLLSGTLDVDRLDYLVRDSRYTGVPYGICDVEVLINGLALVANPDEGNLVMALRARATRALDDLLWSRYQLFSQVLNHKTNVMLNALLADAIPEAMEESGIPLKRPRTFIDFVAFTDDLVMSSVLTACLRSEHEGKAYDRALVHRDLPLYLGRIDLPPVDHQQTASLTEQHEAIIEAAKIRFASEDLGKPSKAGNIRTWSVESALLKGGGMPYVLDHSKGLRRDILRAPAEPGTYQIVEWTKHKKLPAKVESCHFFIDRDQLNS